MRTVVTGGAGFIGSHLVDRLLADNHHVVVIDNLSTGQLDNLASLQGRSGLEFVNQDITDLSAIRPLFHQVGWVFHLAALADIVPSIQRPLDYYHSNASGTLSILEASRLEGVEKFLYAASSSCYGIPDEYPTPESAPIRPQYPYALTKYLGELAVTHWSELYDFPAISLRLFNVYGPRSRTSGTYGAVFGVFLAQKLAGLPFTVVGDGSQTRDFTYVSDVVDAFVMAAQSSLHGEIMNVGSGQTYSVNRLVRLLEGEVTHIPKRPGEPDCTFADISKIQKLLGWRPRVSLEEGVRILIENIEFWREAPVWTPETIASETRDWFKYLGDGSSG